MQFEPREYQRKAIQWILDKKRCALFLRMGLGKTSSTLAAIMDLVDQCEVSRVLIVAPPRVASITWPNEIQKWDQFHCLEPYIISTEDLPVKRVGKKTLPIVSKGTRERLLSHGVCYTIGQDNLWRLTALFQNVRWPFNVVVLDESSGFKDHGSLRFKAARRIASKVDYLIELTGTPSPNGIEHLFSQVRLLDGGARLGESFTEFRARFMRPTYQIRPDVYKWEPRVGAFEEIMALISDICMSMRSEDWITLPEVVMNVIEVELNEQARALYDEMDQEFMVELEGQTVEAKTGGDKFGKLLQLCNGFLYRKGTAIKVHDCKLEALKELVETSQGNILIAYYYEHDKDLILKTFKQAKALGKDPALIDEWNRGEVPIMLVHPQSAGHGLNIQFGGSVIIWYGVTADLEAYQQLNARLHRFGQQSDKVIINHILAKGTKDEYVYYELLANKAQTQSDVLDALDHRHKISDSELT